MSHIAEVSARTVAGMLSRDVAHAIDDAAHASARTLPAIMVSDVEMARIDHAHATWMHAREQLSMLRAADATGAHLAGPGGAVAPDAGRDALKRLAAERPLLQLDLDVAPDTAIRFDAPTHIDVLRRSGSTVASVPDAGGVPAPITLGHQIGPTRGFDNERIAQIAATNHLAGSIDPTEAVVTIAGDDDRVLLAAARLPRGSGLDWTSLVNHDRQAQLLIDQSGRIKRLEAFPQAPADVLPAPSRTEIETAFQSTTPVGRAATAELQARLEVERLVNEAEYRAQFHTAEALGPGTGLPGDWQKHAMRARWERPTPEVAPQGPMPPVAWEQQVYADFVHGGDTWVFRAEESTSLRDIAEHIQRGLQQGTGSLAGVYAGRDGRYYATLMARDSVDIIGHEKRPARTTLVSVTSMLPNAKAREGAHLTIPDNPHPDLRMLVSRDDIAVVGVHDARHAPDELVHREHEMQLIASDRRQVALPGTITGKRRHAHTAERMVATGNVIADDASSTTMLDKIHKSYGIVERPIRRAIAERQPRS